MNITDSIKYVGVDDRKNDLFEGQYKIPNGISYNSYVIVDEKTAVMDTVGVGYTHEWLDNIQSVLGNRAPDYLIVQHMEPDHSANIVNFLKVYPNTAVVASDKAFGMMKNFFGTDFADNRIAVRDGDTLFLGTHTLKFFTAPMVHWPEVIVTYDSFDKVLFSADAFGKFGTPDTNEEWESEARRYYFGIVGKYGVQVQALLKKLSGLETKKICSLHGPVLSDNLERYIGLYNTWSSYLPEEDGTVIAYTSVYSNTKKAAELLENRLRSSGCPKIVLHDLARCDMSQAVSDAFRYGKLVLATTTYNADIFPHMKTFISHLTERGFSNRTVAFIENGSWAPVAAKVMREMLDKCKGLTFCDNSVKIMSAVNEDTRRQIDALAGELCREYSACAVSSEKDGTVPLSNIEYGLYLVTSRDGEKNNGLIVNSVTQLTNTPNRIAVTINKDNYSYHVIKKTGKMNINCLVRETPFGLFERFGFSSGRNTDKFRDIDFFLSDNNLPVLSEYVNSFISLEVEQYADFETHGMFICKISQSKVLNDLKTMTYTYYRDSVKPKPKSDGKRGYVCKICGYVYEGDTLPADFICPLCKHPASDFEEI